ncbi:MAG: tetratricopeptide repeat protein [Chloroflexi bacterium]|nr:tetratricopeptide repeat protein [Chloroflexota bacterium]
MKRKSIVIAVLVLTAILVMGMAAFADDKSAEDFFNEGKTFYNGLNYTSASQSFREAIRLNPNYAEAHYYMGLTLEALGMNRQAITEFNSVKELAPNSNEGRLSDLEIQKLQSKIVNILIPLLAGELTGKDAEQFTTIVKDRLRDASIYEVMYLPERESAAIADDCQLARDRKCDYVLHGRTIEAKSYVEHDPDDKTATAPRTYVYELRFSGMLVEVNFQTPVDYIELKTKGTSTSNRDDARMQAWNKMADLVSLQLRASLSLRLGLDPKPPYLELPTKSPEVKAYCMRMPIDEARNLPIVINTGFVDHTGDNASLADQATIYLQNRLFYSGKYAVVIASNFSDYFPYPLSEKDPNAYINEISQVGADYLVLNNLDWLAKNVGGFIFGSTVKIDGRIHSILMNPNSGKMLQEWESKKSERAASYLFAGTKAVATEGFYSERKYLLLDMVDEVLPAIQNFITANYKPHFKPEEPGGPAAVTDIPQPDYGATTQQTLDHGVRSQADAKAIFEFVKKQTGWPLEWDWDYYKTVSELSRKYVKNFVGANGVQYAIFYPPYYTATMICEDMEVNHMPYIKRANGKFTKCAVAVSRCDDGKQVIIYIK